MIHSSRIDLPHHAFGLRRFEKLPLPHPENLLRCRTLAIKKKRLYTHGDADAKLDDGLEGVENGEEVAVALRQGFERRGEGELAGQLLRQVHPVGLLDLAAGPEAQGRKAIVAVGDVEVFVVDQRHRRLQQVVVRLCEQTHRGESEIKLADDRILLSDQCGRAGKRPIVVSRRLPDSRRRRRQSAVKESERAGEKRRFGGGH